MLVTTQYHGFNAVQKRAKVDFVGNVENIVNQQTYTFAAATIGLFEHQQRMVVLLIASGVNAGTSVTAVTIGGIAATLVVAAAGGRIEMWQAVVPTGLTADIIISYSASKPRTSVGIYNVSEYDTTAAFAAVTANTATATVSMSVGVQAEGVLIGGAWAASSQTGTWVQGLLDANENFDTVVEAINAFSGASAEVPQQEPGKIVQLNWTGGTASYIVLASWR